MGYHNSEQYKGTRYDVDLLIEQISCFTNPIEKELFRLFASDVRKEWTVDEIMRELKKVFPWKKGTLDTSNIRKYLRKMVSHKLLKETYRGRPKRYKIEEIGICSLLEASKISVKIRPLRGPLKHEDRFPVVDEILIRNILGRFLEKYVSDSEKREKIIREVYITVDTWLRKINLFKIDYTTLLALIDEALYLIDRNLGFRFRLIGGSPDYWNRYSRIKDALDIHTQPLDKRISMDLHLQSLPDYVLPYFIDGLVYAHGLRAFSKLFSISVDMRPFFEIGINTPHYVAGPPKHVDSVLAFCRKIPILCGQQSAGSIVINNFNTVVSPYLSELNDKDLAQWIQNLIRDLYELYAIRPKDPTFCGLVLNYEKSPLDTEKVVGKDAGNTYEAYSEVAKKIVNIFLEVYNREIQSANLGPYPRIFIRISKNALRAMPKDTIKNIEEIILKFGENNPIYFINMESNLYRFKPNIVLSVEAQVGGYARPEEQYLSGVSTFFSVFLPFLYEGKRENDVLSSFQKILCSMAQYEQEKIERLRRKSEGILSMKIGKSSSLFDPKYFSLNVGAFGVYDLVSKFGNVSPEEIYRFLSRLKAEVEIVRTNSNIDIRLSHTPRRSGIYRTYQYFMTSRPVGEGWSPPEDWIYVLPSKIETDIEKRISWESRLHGIFDGGYVSRFTLSDEDNLTKFIERVLETDILFFKINLRKNS